DNTSRHEANFSERRNTFDLDFQNHLVLPWNQDLVWGVEYRRTWDRVTGIDTVIFDPQKRSDDLFTSFVQDEIRLTDDVRLTIGSKIEHNAYSGFEWQPSGRIMWFATPRQSIWAGIS